MNSIDHFISILKKQRTYDSYKYCFDNFLNERRREDSYAANILGLENVIHDKEINIKWTFQYLCEMLGDLDTRALPSSEYRLRFALYIEMISHLKEGCSDLNHENFHRLMSFVFSFLRIKSCQWILFEMYNLKETDFNIHYNRSKLLDLDLA